MRVRFIPLLDFRPHHSTPPSGFAPATVEHLKQYCLRVHHNEQAQEQIDKSTDEESEDREHRPPLIASEGGVSQD